MASTTEKLPTKFSKLDADGNSIDYSVVKKLGQGNFATVFKVIHVKTDRVGALKQIDLSEASEDEVDLTFNEVKYLKLINSAHVIRLLDTFAQHEKKTLCVVLEFMDDGDLAGCINRARKNLKLFAENTIWCYLHQICAGLNDMHKMRILHRDLKPENIFLNKNGIVKIGDFGLSRLFSNKTNKAMTRVGTEFYMAPERNDKHGYTFKSDIWSLGCLAYELCALASPFSAERKNAYSLHQKISEVDYPPIPSDEYTKYLTFFIESCLQKNPDDRPSAEECAEISLKMHTAFQEKLKSFPEKEE